MIYDDVLHEIDVTLLRGLVKAIGIPPRPAILTNVQTELAACDPDPRKLAALASRDVSLSAALLKTANSPWMGLLRPADTVERAISMLGYELLQSIMIELVLRRVLPSEGPVLERFWDRSSKRSAGMSYLAKRHATCPADVAHTCGLLMDVGVPIMIARNLSPSYKDTLRMAEANEASFVQIEQERHQMDHAIVGACLARSWGVSQAALLVIRMHHDSTVLVDSDAPEVLRNLLALTFIVEHAAAIFHQPCEFKQWDHTKEGVMHVLSLSQDELDEWMRDLHQLFFQETFGQV